jgi:hypothetical protein
MKLEKAKAAYDEALKRRRPLFEEWLALARPFLEATPPFSEDQLRPVWEADERLKAADSELKTALLALVQVATEEGVDPTELL